MTEQEYKHTLKDLTSSLAEVIRQGAVSIIEPEDTCTADEVAINATIDVCSHLIVESLKDKEHPKIIVCTDELIMKICALIAQHIIDASDVTAIIKKPKTK